MGHVDGCRDNADATGAKARANMHRGAVVFYAFFSRDDDNPSRVNYSRSTAWTASTHTTLTTEQNQLAIKVSADN